MNPPPNPELADALDAATSKPRTELYIWPGTRQAVVESIRNGHIFYASFYIQALLEQLPQWILIAPYIDDLP